MSKILQSDQVENESGVLILQYWRGLLYFFTRRIHVANNFSLYTGSYVCIIAHLKFGFVF